jgi:hypothetical protein
MSYSTQCQGTATVRELLKLSINGSVALAAAHNRALQAIINRLAWSSASDDTLAFAHSRALQASMNARPGDPYWRCTDLRPP